jgi:hypothetical protein
MSEAAFAAAGRSKFRSRADARLSAVEPQQLSRARSDQPALPLGYATCLDALNGVGLASH